MSTGPDVVFLGPSLSTADATELYPNLVVLPPAGMGDILGAANRYRPRAIGLVDGTFLSNMSVFHKELLYAMDQGIWVLGASSMGALRAAECDAYGMIGVGVIYERIRSGDIEDDDEVALTHADRSGGYRALSDALVTIRAGINGAVAVGLLTADQGHTLIALQKDRWFPDRRFSTVAEDARGLGIDPARCASIRDYLRSQVVDPKREDAIALLKRMSELPATPIPAADRPGTVMSGVFTACLTRDVVVQTPDGFSVTFDRIRRYCALHESDYDAAMRLARQNQVLVALSQILGGGPTPDEVAAARRVVCARVGVDEEGLAAYAIDNDLDARGLRVLIVSQAMLLRLEQSWLGRSRLGMVTEPFLNELRLSGRYVEAKASAALQYAAAAGVSFDVEPSAHALITTQSALGWAVPEDLGRYIDEQDLGSIGELLDTMSISVRAHQGLFGIGLVAVDGEQVMVIEDDEPMMTRGR